jgi:branched-chain amino acid transport system permease protein
MALLPTWTQRVLAAIFVAALIVVPIGVVWGSGDDPNGPLSYLAATDWLRILTEVGIFAVGALGLNILTGLAGQVSLGHAFFMGIGAYTAASLGAPAGSLWGLDLPMWIWLPAAGIVAALFGALIAPTAVRVRGLYLAIVTLGLVFVGEWMFRSFADVTGGSQSGREFPSFDFELWQEAEPALSFTSDGPAWFWIDWLDWLLGPWINFGEVMAGELKTYLFVLFWTIVFVIAAKNLQRTRVGRSFMAIRDRDIAAEVMGVAEAKGKLQAFAISSFYAGIAGALLASFVGRLIPESFNLFLSVQFVAIILIGGAGTVAGTLMGSFFVIALPRLVQDFSDWLTGAVETGGFGASVADLIVSTGAGDAGLVSTSAGTTPGLTVFQLNLVLYGLLIIVFLIFEPLGLYGIWIRIRNYWKGWPFTY